MFYTFSISLHDFGKIFITTTLLFLWSGLATWDSHDSTQGIFYNLSRLSILGAQESTGRLSELRTRSQQSDIATSSYFELQQMARELGIDANQDAEKLRSSLYKKLGIPAPVKEGDSEDDEMIIRIEAAQKAQAFTIERQDDDKEEYFKISGGVRVLIQDKREGYQHQVSADNVTFNRNQDTIRAEGSVIYIKKKLNDDGDGEKFTGDSLIFRLRIWRGVIFYGIFSRQQTIETQRPENAHNSSSNPEKTKTDPSVNTETDADELLGKTVLAENNIYYYFGGEKIRKGSDEILVLEKGKISTSDNEQTEYFRLGFHRLWIFGKPEWAMLSATLYVGHIPVLYLPYYYHNDSQLVFHPVFGVREAYGEFLQTTTYLLGQPEVGSSDSLSFLPVNSGAEESSTLELNALYLVPKEESAAGSKQAKNLGHTLKFLLDYYSYIGLFTGFESTFKDLGFIRSLEADLSLAYAYALEERSGPGYATGKPFIRGSDGSYSLQPVRTYLFGQEIPFRYGFETKIQSKESILNLDFQYYSDPFYRRDYFNRAESFDWIGYALERAQRTSGDLLEELRKKNSTISSYKWELGLNFRPRLDIPLISSFDLKAYIAAYFDKRVDSSREAYDPMREFFYPTKFFFPDTSLRISGTIWPLNLKKTDTASAQPLAVLQDWKYQQDEQEDSEETADKKTENFAGNLSKPRMLEKIGTEKQLQAVSFKSNYNISLQNLLQSQTDSSLWTQIEDIKLNNKELQFTGTESLQLVTEWDILDEFLNIRLKHNLSFNVTHYFNISDNPQSSNDLLATKQANKWNWNEESSIVLKPLYQVDWFANSSISHTLKVALYDYRYDTTKGEHEGKFLDLTLSDEDLRKYITSHRLVALFDFHPIKNSYNPINNLQFSFSMTHELPPIVPKSTFKPRLSFEFFKWSHDISLEIQQSGEDDPNYYVLPLNYTSIYKPLDKLEIKNIFIYNFEGKDENKEGHVEREEVSFKAWWFSGGLTFRYTQPYNWNKNNLTWDSSGDLDFLADKTYLGFQLITKDHYLWKNRILYYFSFKMRWDQDLIRYNQTSSLTLDFTLSFFIHEFLNFQISYRMSNENLYLYYPGMKDLLGFTKQYYFFEDLLNSVSIWDQEKLKKGLFKIKDIRVLAIHHLKDWDLIFEFAGKPKLVDNNLSWDYALGFYLRWIPIPLIKRRALQQGDSFSTDAR